MFFTTFLDIKPILEKFESAADIQYFQAGLFDNQNLKHFNSMIEKSDLGFVQKGDWNYIDRFLIIRKNDLLNIRSIPQKKGGIKYAIDSLANPKSATIKIGGIYKDNILIPGSMGIVSENDFSQYLYKEFSSLIKKECKKIEEFYVGKESEDKLKKGWRLVTNELLSEGFDLKNEK